MFKVSAANYDQKNSPSPVIPCHTVLNKIVRESNTEIERNEILDLILDGFFRAQFQR